MVRASTPHPIDAAFRLLTLRRVRLWRIPGEPHAVGLLWLLAYVAIKLTGPDHNIWYYDLARPLAQLGLAVIAGMFVAALLRKSGDALRFAFAFLLIASVALLLQSALDALVPDDVLDDQGSRLVVPAAGIILAVRFVFTASGWSRPLDKLRASVAAGAILAAALAWSDGERVIYQLAAAREDGPGLPDIDAEQLWTAQPARLAAQLARLPAGGASEPRTYVIGVAAGGMQRIFGREVSMAGNALTHRFGADSGTAVLSNSEDDIARLPMANRTNLSVLLDEVGRRADPRRDLVVVYLASHGSREAELSTGLPDYTRLQPISAEYLAEALRHAGIGRRLVVVSACYSGSWIKPLAARDAIVLTASAADRTSFGCDDKRDTTEFGEAFIRHIGRQDASLRMVFEGMQHDIDRNEESEKRGHSLPQSFVGGDMQALWVSRE